MTVNAEGVLMAGAKGSTTWTPVMDGLGIPRVERLFAPEHGNRIYASTPAGLYHLKVGENRWESSHLVMQWRKNERRELGGAAFITAYWRALQFGFLKPPMTTVDHQKDRAEHGP